MRDGGDGELRSIAWARAELVVVDQTALPEELRHLHLRDVDGLVDAIARLAVRGAVVLGVAGALGVALAARQAEREGWSDAQLGEAIERVRSARPTAVNLAWGVDRAAAALRAGGPDAALALGLQLVEDDERTNRALAERAADLVDQGLDGPVRVMTHCNTGALACAAFGTALGAIRVLHERGRLGLVLAGETRPLLQGARLTSWELARLGAEHRLVADGAGPGLIARGAVDAVLVGADRITARGDVANKVGTYPLALAAARAGVPFVVVAPESTVDLSLADGDGIEVEERPEDEVLCVRTTRVAPPGARALNPAFDVTPADLVTAVVTEGRVVRPARGERL